MMTIFVTFPTGDRVPCTIQRFRPRENLVFVEYGFGPVAVPLEWTSLQ